VTARARDEPPSFPPVRLGIIGLGAMGGEMLDAAAGAAGAVVAVAADVHPPAVERHRRRHPDVRFTTDPDEVLDADGLEAIYIATPPAHHADLVLAGLRRGLAVFCEKPLAVARDDGERMLHAASAAGAPPCFVNFALSDRHAVLVVEQALRAGEVGRVVGVDVRLQFARWPRQFQAGAGWVATRAQGGFVREVFSHFAYLTDRLVGPIRSVDVGLDHPADPRDGAEVAARGLLRAGDVPVHVSALSGVSAFSTTGDERCEWILWGTRRSFLLRDWDRLFVSAGGDWAPVPLTGERGSDTTRLSRFAAAVRGGAVEHLADFPTAFRVQAAVEAFHDGGVPGS
jgi:predicted dehydrogenase